jgi:hypothetical protein
VCLRGILLCNIPNQTTPTFKPLLSHLNLHLLVITYK